MGSFIFQNGDKLSAASGRNSEARLGFLKFQGRLNNETDENVRAIPAEKRRDASGHRCIHGCGADGHDKQTTDDGLEVYYLAPMLDPVNNYLNYESPDYVETAKELKEANNG